MTTEQMQYFIVMAETLSFTKTANHFFLTQPTLSRHIKRIEEEFGAELFKRNGATVAITEAGKTLYSGLKHIYQQYVDLGTAVKAATCKGKTFRVGLGEEQMMDNVILLAINLFRAKHPDVDLSIHRANHHDLLFGVAEGKYDVADTVLGPEGYDSLSVAYLKLAEEPVYLAMAKSLRSKFPDKLTLERFKEIIKNYCMLFPAEENFSSGKAGSIGPGLKFVEEHGLEGMEIKVRTVGSPISIPIQVTAGLGVTICNKSNLFSVDPAAAVVEVEGLRPFTKVLFYQKESGSSLLKDFLLILQAKLQEQAANA